MPELTDLSYVRALCEKYDFAPVSYTHLVQSQISVLKGQIAEVQNSIGLKEQEIAAKEQQILSLIHIWFRAAGSAPTALRRKRLLNMWPGCWTGTS